MLTQEFSEIPRYICKNLFSEYVLSPILTTEEPSILQRLNPVFFHLHSFDRLLESDSMCETGLYGGKVASRDRGN